MARHWMVAIVFAASVGAGWGSSAIARECRYPYVAETASLTLVEVTRDGEIVEDVSAWKADEGGYGVRGESNIDRDYPAISVFYEGQEKTYNVPFLQGER